MMEHKDKKLRISWQHGLHDKWVIDINSKNAAISSEESLETVVLFFESGFFLRTDSEKGHMTGKTLDWSRYIS